MARQAGRPDTQRRCFNRPRRAAKDLREVYQDEAEARRAADAAVREIKAGEGDMRLLLVGYPLARAEAPIVVEGVSLDLDGRWIATRVNHEWNFESGGATTEIIAEFGADDDDAAAS
ncbi:MAG: hypothetical protein Q4615_05535 [Paracoccus aminovorans]|nr:hypothetical protein [Paracoccus aminovorans]